MSGERMNRSLFEVQVNGFAGTDFQQDALTEEALLRAVRGLAAHQTERFFATFITDAPEAVCARLAHMERLRAGNEILAAAICGYHLEGPWVSPEPGFIGAHDPKCVSPPSIEAFERFQAAANGCIRLITLAPELPGSAELIRHATACGVAVSLGHTNASDADIDGAIAAGARFCTHLGNGIPPLVHRHDNVMQRLLARDELTAFFIPDGIHIPPPMLKNLFRAKPPGRALFTTDCMSAAGAPAGRYRLGKHELEVGEDRVVRVPGSPMFAGSALTPDQGVINLEAWLGLAPEAARTLFSTAVAERFGIELPRVL